MADIELLTTKHYDELIRKINEGSGFDWTQVNSRNIRSKEIYQKETYRVTGPALLFGRNRRIEAAWCYITANGFTLSSDVLGASMPFLFAPDGFSLEGKNSWVTIYYFLI